MKLETLSQISSESGHCHVAPLPSLAYLGENVSGEPSPLRLFEDGVEIGPGSSLHDDIRKLGGGRFSHWGDTLFFSTSDNSDPNANRRTYHYLAPQNPQEARLESSGTPALSRRAVSAVLRRSVSTAGSELHMAFSLRLLLRLCARSGVDLTGKTCLEIGASPGKGLAIALLLLGVEKIYLNNILPLDEQVDVDFARNMAVLTGMIANPARNLDDVMIFDPDGASCRIRPDLAVLLGSADAADLPRHMGAVDFIFSFSVLEHIRDLPTVMRSLRLLCKPTAVAIHAVDARDHTALATPLKYLYLDDAAFETTYTPDNNRWRWPEYLEIFRGAGWTIGRQAFMGSLPVLANGETDVAAMMSRGIDRLLHDDHRDLEPVITADGVSKLHSHYHRFTPEEISVLAFVVTLTPVDFPKTQI